jgi:Tat protein secretion system quality control protein TatD with DNase activity
MTARFASADIQRKHFRMYGTGQPRRSASPLTTVHTPLGSQLVLAKKYHLPLFLHSRAAHDDFVQILREEGFGADGGRAVIGRGGIIHSFTGSIKDTNDYVCTTGLKYSRLA